MPKEFIWRGRNRTARPVNNTNAFSENVAASQADIIDVLGMVVAPGSIGDDLRDIFVLKKGWEVQAAVCQLNIGPSTGFMISENVLLTCHHVLKTEAAARVCRASFNLQLDENRVPMTPEEYQLDPEALFHTDEGLDLTVVQVKGKPLKGAPGIKVASAFPRVDASAIIIQHPSHPIYSSYKMIGLSGLRIAYAKGRELQYESDTLPGSSGSPVFDDQFNLIGVHSSGVLEADGGFPARNHGIHVNAVIDFLLANKLKRLVVEDTKL